MLQRKVEGSNPDEVIRFFNLPDPSSCNMSLGFTYPLTEMNIRNLSGGKIKTRPPHKFDNITAICLPIV
jgi:hypothetical protein